jgi:hypothetical protein
MIVTASWVMRAMGLVRVGRARFKVSPSLLSSYQDAAFDDRIDVLENLDVL